jgi:hypothetical protein
LCLSGYFLAILAHPFAAVAPSYTALSPFFRLDWSSEEEFRWVYFDENSAPLFLSFDDALEGVIIGEKVPKEHEEAFLRYCALYEAEITDLEWRNGYPKIVHPGQPYITHQHLLNT